MPDERQCEGGVEDLPVRIHQGGEQVHEADQHDPVRGTDTAELEHAGVSQRLDEQDLPTVSCGISAAESGLAQLHHADDAHDCSYEQCDTEHGARERQNKGHNSHGQLRP